MNLNKDYLDYGANYIDLNNVNINLSGFEFLTKDIMKKYCMLPIEVNEETAYIAMGNPDDKETIDKIGFLINKPICVIAAKKEQIHSLINSIEDIKQAELVLSQFWKEEKSNDSTEDIPNRNGRNISLESSPVVTISNSIIGQAIDRRASDVHIEPFEDIVVIRYRIDGVLQDNRTIPRNLYISICTRIKIQSGMDIAEKRIPQDGKLQFKHKDRNYDLRISTLPTIYGEKIVVRVLYKQEKLVSLNSLGFSIEGVTSITENLKNNHGLILVTGPTGCGKTTTLYSMLNEIDKYHNNIIAIEDPTEVPINRVNQVNVNVKAGLTFASGLRSVLRQDPDVILVGEIRDTETADIAVRAAITGHMVLSTLHTNDAVSSVTRLNDMAVPNYLIADSLIACVAQRLVRKICDFCKTHYLPSENEKTRLQLSDDEHLYKGKGCVFCNNTGYRFRTVVYEILHIDSSMRYYISKGKDAQEIRDYCKSNGMTTINHYGRELVRKGVTTYEEFIKLGSYNW